MRKRKLGRRVLQTEYLETRALLAGDVANLGAMLEDRVASFYERADGSDGSEPDGLLTADEVSQRAWSRLSAADADESGGVSQEELIAYIGEHVGDGAGGMGHHGRGRPEGLGGDRGGHLGGCHHGHGQIDPEMLAERIAAAVDRVFAAADGSDGSDPDGVLTEGEVSERLWGKISAADGADGTEADGAISKDELIADINARIAERPSGNDGDDDDGDDDDGAGDDDEMNGGTTDGSGTDGSGTDGDTTDDDETDDGTTDGSTTDGSETDGGGTEPLAAAASVADTSHTNDIPPIGHRGFGIRGPAGFRSARGFGAA